MVTATARSSFLRIHVLHFIVGFCAGVLFYQLYHVQGMALRGVNPLSSSVKPAGRKSFILKNTTLKRAVGGKSFILKNTTYFTRIEREPAGANQDIINTKGVTARRFSDNPRILCLVQFQAKLKRKFVDEINATWGRQCDYLRLVKEGNNKKLRGYRIKEVYRRKKIVFMKENWDWKPCWKENCRNSIWNFLFSAPTLREFDWVVRPHGKAYVVIPNLKYALSSYNSSVPLYFGNSQLVDGNLRLIDAPVQILSRAAVRELTRFQTTNKCNVTNGSQLSSFDYSFSEIMECVKNAKMGIIRPFDAKNRPYFTANLLEDDITGNGPQDTVEAGMNRGFDCCSDLMIAFKVGLQPSQMYKYHFFINQIHPFGISPPHFMVQ